MIHYASYDMMRHIIYLIREDVLLWLVCDAKYEIKIPTIMLT